MKIYNKIVIEWNEATQRYDDVLFEDSFEYGGELALAAENCICGGDVDCADGKICLDDGISCDSWTPDEPDYCFGGVCWGVCVDDSDEGGEEEDPECEDHMYCMEVYDVNWRCVAGQCESFILGCIDPDATNTTPGATWDDGSCTYPPEPDVPSEVTVNDTEIVDIDASSTFDYDDPIANLIFTWSVDGPGEIQPGSLSGDITCSNCVGHYSYYGIGDYFCIGVTSELWGGEIPPLGGELWLGDCDNAIPDYAIGETIITCSTAQDQYHMITNITIPVDPETGIADPEVIGSTGDQVCDELDVIDPSTLSWQDRILVGETETATVHVTVTDPGGLSDTTTVDVTIHGTGVVVIPTVNYYFDYHFIDTTVPASTVIQPESITNPDELPITFYDIGDDNVPLFGVDDNNQSGLPEPRIGSYYAPDAWMNSTYPFSDFIQVINPESGDYEIEVLDDEFYGRLVFFTAWSAPAVGNLSMLSLPGQSGGICSLNQDESCAYASDCTAPPEGLSQQCIHRVILNDGTEVVGAYEQHHVIVNMDTDLGPVLDHIIEGEKGAPEGNIQLTGGTGSELNLFINEYTIELSGDPKGLISPLGYAVQDRDGNSTYEIEIELIEGIGKDTNASPGTVLPWEEYVPTEGREYTFEQNGKYEIQIRAFDVWGNPGTVKLNILISGVVATTSSVLGYYSPHQGIAISGHESLMSSTGYCGSAIGPGTSQSGYAECNQAWVDTGECIELIAISAGMACVDNPGFSTNCDCETDYVDFYGEPEEAGCVPESAPCDMESGICYTAEQGYNYCEQVVYACSELSQSTCQLYGTQLGCSWESVGIIEHACTLYDTIDCYLDSLLNDKTTFDPLDGDPRQRLGLYYWNEIQPSETTHWSDVITIDPQLKNLSSPFDHGMGSGKLFTPDADVRTTYSLEESQDAPLFKYYDRDIQFGQYESAVAPGKTQISFYPRLGAGDQCNDPDNETISPFSSHIPLHTNPAGELERGKFYIIALDWGDDSDIEYDREPLYTETENATHSYKKSGIYRITGYMIKMNKDSSEDDYDPVFDEVKDFIRFELYISINKRIGFEDDFKLLGGDDYTYIPYSETTPVISGISESSLYHKTIARAVGYIGESRLDIEFPNQGELARTEYALANMVDGLSGYAEIDRYNEQVWDVSENPDQLIHGEQYPLRGELGDWVGSIDLAQVRVFTKPLQMYEMLGFEGDEPGTPYNEQYWQSIISDDWDIFHDREGWGVDEDQNSIIDVTSSQNWDRDGETYYYPVLPKLNTQGAFDEFGLGLQGQTENDPENIPFGTLGRVWDQDDDSAPITATDLQDESLILDLDFSKARQKSLSDRSGAQNVGMLIGDYAIRYDEKRYAVGKKQSIDPVIRKKQQRKAY